ncbi:hypothetical protein [Tissierella praeacuta]|uniref:hypothetical protein n=1 Tax=Tissierella praeacuta TaxID=43131 RepID=UPI00333F5A96
MFKGYKQIFWGIFIATFNIKLGPIKILPAFVGLLLISIGLRKLYEETKVESFHKTQVIGVLAASISFIAGLLNYFSDKPINYSIPILVFMAVYNIIELILFFKILESSIEYLDSNNYTDIANENIAKLKGYTIISVINIVLMNFALLFNINKLIFFVSLIGVILRIFIMVLVNRLKKLFIEVETLN